jgi:thioredoxin 1
MRIGLLADLSYSSDACVRSGVAATLMGMSHHPLPMIEERDFEAEVLRSPVPVLVEFGAEWCPPCRALEPILTGVAHKLEGRARVVRMDADASPTVAARYRVRAVPTVVAILGGEERGRHTGLTSAEVLLRLLGPPGP